MAQPDTTTNSHANKVQTEGFSGATFKFDENDAFYIRKKYGIIKECVLKNTDPQTSANYGVFVTVPHAMDIYRVIARHRVASTSGTVQLRKVPDGSAVSAGTDILKTPISTAGTANTNTERTKFDIAVNRVGQGESLALVPSGTLTNLEELVVTVYMVPVSRGDHII